MILGVITIKRINERAPTISIVALIVLLVMNFFYLLNIGSDIQQVSKNTEKEIKLLSERIGNFEEVLKDEKSTVLLKQDEEMIDFLKSEYENFQTFANNDRESFFNLINLFFVALGVLVTGATLVLYWLFGQSREEVSNNAGRVIQASVENIERESQEKINTILQPKITEIDGKYQELLRVVDSGYKLRNSKFALICHETEQQDIEARLLGRLRAITPTQMYYLDEFEVFKEKLSSKEIDMIIYVYKKTYETSNDTFKAYIQHLINGHSQVPIIVYIENDRVDGGDADLLNAYPYSSLANIPATLTTNAIAMANLLSYEGGNSNDC